MCQSLDLLNEINNKIKEVNERYRILCVEISTLDRLQQDILHSLDSIEKISMYKAWRVLTSLIKVRNKRRQVKNEHGLLTPVVERLNKSLGEDIFKKRNEYYEKLQLGAILYNSREIDINKDIYEQVEYALGNMDEQTKESFINNKEEHIYKLGEKLPDEKGSNVTLKFHNEQQIEHITKYITKNYKGFSIDENNGTIRLIYKK